MGNLDQRECFTNEKKYIRVSEGSNTLERRTFGKLELLLKNSTEESHCPTVYRKGDSAEKVRRLNNS